jgi:hypothetical protein
VIGSSFALPMGVEIEDAFHSILEERLSSRSRERAYEFINFSVAAYGPNQMLATLRHRALAYDPDVVLFTLTSLSVAPMLLAWDTPRDPPFPVWRNAPGPRSLLMRVVRLQLGPPPPQGSPELAYPVGALESGNVLTRLGEVSLETGVPVVLVRLAYDDVTATRVEREVEARARVAKLHYLDTRSAFRGTNQREFWVGRRDRHPNSRAHAIFADPIADFLYDEGLIAN